MGIYKQQLKDLLKKMVEIKSITGNELDVAFSLEQYFNKFGINGKVDIFEQNRGNFIASNLTNPNKKTLILCSHIDVVPGGDMNSWNSHPFVFTEKDNLWYARGVCDAKGSVAAMAIAFLNIIKQKNFDGNIVFLAVSGEEKGGVGAKRFLETNGRFHGWAIIGEPTDGNVNLSQKGRIEFKVDVSGFSGHASRPEKAENAIMAAAKLLQELKPYIDQTNSIENSYGEKSSIAVTQIDTIGNTSTTTIPGLCRLVFDRRWIYTENADNIINEFISEVQNISETISIKTSVDFRVGVPAVHVNTESMIVKSALKACETIKKEKIKPLGFPASCDMYVFENAGIDTIVMGAGNIYDNFAHGSNEFIKPEDLEQIIEIYIQTINNIFNK